MSQDTPAKSGLDAALFVSALVHMRPVKLGDGSVHELHFKEVTALEFRRFQLAERSDDPEVRATSVALLLAASVCDADGAPALTVGRAAQLKPAVAQALLLAVLDVNGLAVDAAKAQAAPGNATLPGATTDGSGTSSPSHSADAPSTSGSA